MDKKLGDIVEGLTDEQLERLRAADALRDAVRVEIGGVDIASLPRLPPELRVEEAQRPEPPGKGQSPTTGRRQRGKRGM